MNFVKVPLSAIVAATLGLACASQAQARAPSTEAEATWLEAHNEARRDFGSPALRWNEELERDAREWAQRLARENRLRHEPRDQREGAGENLWLGSRGVFRPQQMIDDLVNEERFFRAGKFPNVSTTGNWRDVGHYTQIVWPETREVGCAMASGRRSDVLVCRYSPAGNFAGTVIGRRGSSVASP